MGKNPRETALLLRKALGITLSRALRIARTETLRAYREATRQSYQANSDIVKGWVWHSALGTRTCAMCWAMHGTVHRLDERLDDHPNGRCAMVPLTATWAEIGKKHGIDLSGVSDTNPQIEPGILLFEGLSAEEQIKILGPAKYAAWKEGKITLSDLVGRKRSEVWGTYRYEKSLSELGLIPNKYVGEAKESSGIDAILRQVESEIVNQRYETAVVLDLDGSIVLRKDGDKSGVDFTFDELKMMIGKILTHNHPGGWKYSEDDVRRGGSSFSVEDIAIAARFSLREIRAISPGYIYSMKPGSSGWPLLDVIVDKLEQIKLQVIGEFYNRIIKGEVTKEEAEAELWHEIMVRFANQYGMVYTRIRR